MTPNTVPAVIGVGVAFTNLPPGGQTPNFNLEPGTWAVSLELYENTQNLGTDQVTMVQTTAGSGNAANTTVLTMNRSGYYNLVVSAGPVMTFNFQTVNGCANVRCNMVGNKIGPS